LLSPLPPPAPPPTPSLHDALPISPARYSCLFSLESIQILVRFGQTNGSKAFASIVQRQICRQLDQSNVAIRSGKGKIGEWVIFRSEEHTSELQSRFDLVCRLLLEK